MRRSALIVGPNCGRKPCVWTREFWGVGFAKVTSPSGRSDARGQSQTTCFPQSYGSRTGKFRIARPNG